MIKALYMMSHWEMGAVVVGIVTGGALAIFGLYHATRRGRKPHGEEAALGPAFAGIIATVTSLLLAFTSVSVWEAFKAADNAVTNEAASSMMLARDLSSLGGPDAHAAREELRGYLTSVIEKEWPLLEDGGVSQDTRGRFDKLFRAVARIEPKTKREEVIAGEVWAKLNDLSGNRRERLMASRSRVPETLWAVVVIGTLLTVLCACTVPADIFGWTMMAALSASFGLVFFFILAMDRPYSGRESVQPDAIQDTLDNMTFWDKNTAPAGRR